MAEIITDGTAAPGELGNNDAGTEGAGTGTASNTGKSFTQDQVNSLIQARLVEERKRAKTKQDEAIAAALETAKTGFEKTLDETVAAKLTEREAAAAMATTRAALVEELGLTEAQVARLNGNTPEELKADAKLLFGKLIDVKDPIAEARKLVAEKTGLTEKQVARLNGDTYESMLADAVELFNAKVVEGSPADPPADEEQKTQPKPPILQAGGTGGQPVTFGDMSTMSAADIRANRAKLWPNGQN